jgi:Cft2 family RNA processing exonuclease
MAPDTALADLAAVIDVTLNQGGNILIPAFPSGIIFDLIEYLHMYNFGGKGLPLPLLPCALVNSLSHPPSKVRVVQVCR